MIKMLNHKKYFSIIKNAKTLPCHVAFPRH